MKTKPSQQEKSFTSVSEIARETNRDRRTVRKRLEEANCWPLPPGLNRGDVVALMDDGEEPAYTAEQNREITERLARLLAAERERTARKVKR